MLRRIIAIWMSLAVILSISTSALASEKEFNLIDYLETHEVTTRAELIELLEENTNSLVCVNTHTLTYVSDLEEEEVDFRVSIDYENQLVEVDTVYELATANSTRSGSATHETYSDLGVLLYTLTINGTFSYNASSCTNTARSGSYTKGSLSFWSSTPTISHGNITTTKAYARISGTATFLFDSSTYRLTLMCDTSGTLTSSFTRP